MRPKWRLIAVVLKSRHHRRTSQMIRTLSVNVVLPNGHAEPLTLLPSSLVQDVNTMAQRALGKKYIRLIKC